MNKNLKMKDWKYLILEQRKVITNGILHNYKLKEIVEVLGYDPTSISKEAKRNREQITIGINQIRMVKKQIIEISSYFYCEKK